MKLASGLSAALAISLLNIAVLAQDTATTTHALKVDRNHSTIAFNVPIMKGLSKVTGKFTDFDLSIVRKEADITKSTINATVRVASIDTGIKDRDDDLKGPAFFDATKFPTITFASRSIEKLGDHFVVHGTLTMKGVAREVDLPFNITGEADEPDGGTKLTGFHGTMNINRRDYSITWEHKGLATFVGDDVEISIDLIAS